MTAWRCALARRRRLHQNRHIPGFMLISRHALMRFWQLIPFEGLAQARVQPTIDHELVRFRRLFQRREMAAFDTLLAHPYVARIEGEIVAGGACAEDNHAAPLRHHARDREGRFTWVFEHHINVIALAGDVSDRAAKAPRALHVSVEALRVIHIGQGAPTIKVPAVNNANCAHAFHIVRFFLARDHGDWLCANCGRHLQREGAKTARSAPNQNMLARPKLVWRLAKHHPIGGCEGQRVTGAFFPCQMLWAGQKLAALDAAELRECAIWRLLAPDALARAHHRIAAIAVGVVAIILVAVHDDFIAELPMFYLAANRPYDA